MKFTPTRIGLFALGVGTAALGARQLAKTGALAHPFSGSTDTTPMSTSSQSNTGASSDKAPAANSSSESAASGGAGDHNRASSTAFVPRTTPGKEPVR